MSAFLSALFEITKNLIKKLSHLNLVFMRNFKHNDFLMILMDVLSLIRSYFICMT